MADKRGGIGIAPGRGPGPSRAGVAGTSSDSDSDLAEYGTAPSAPQTPRLRGMSLGALGFAGFGTPSTFASPGASAIALDETAPLLSPFMTPRSPRTPKNTQRKHRPRMHRRGSSRRSARGRRAPPIYVFPAIFLLILFLLALFAAWDVTLGGCRVAWVCDLLGGEPIDEVWARTTGAYAPWRSRGPDGDVAPLPKGCVVDQVSVLHRHTGRYPTPGSGDLLRTTLKKLAERRNRAPSNRHEFAFLAYTDLTLEDWKMGKLTDGGRQAAYDSGKRLAAQYPALELFTRTTDKARVAESAQFWLEGYAGADFNTSTPMPNMTMPEGSAMNNTLSVRSCSAYEHLEPPAGSKEYARGLDLLQPAADRLNALLGPNPPLDTADVVRIASMCGFDTTLRADTGWSKWCRVLSRDEWEAAGYLADMARWYRVGEGSAFGHIMGAGWVNELLARLRDRVPEDTTTVNRTLDGNPRTFPRGGNRLFVDFTHDNEMVEIMTALGVRKLRTKLPTSHIPTDEHTRNRFVLADLVPFGARWAVERVVCTMSEEDEERQGEPEGEQLHHSYAYPTKLRRPHRPKQPAKDRTYVRVLINEKPVHIDHLACRSSARHADFMCPLKAFVESQAWSQTDVDWTDCLEKKQKGHA